MLRVRVIYTEYLPVFWGSEVWDYIRRSAFVTSLHQNLGYLNALPCSAVFSPLLSQFDSTGIVGHALPHWGRTLASVWFLPSSCHVHFLLADLGFVSFPVITTKATICWVLWIFLADHQISVYPWALQPRCPFRIVCHSQDKENWRWNGRIDNP